MDSFLDFITLKDPNVFFVLIGVICINISSALIGTFAFLRRRSLIGDAIAHALLPGICLGFLVTGQKNTWFLFGGAFLTGWLSTYLVDFIVNRSRVKQDAAIGIVLSSFFGFGAVLLTYIQNGNYTDQSGLNHFLFGQAAAINKDELLLFFGIMVVVIAVIVLFYRPFVQVSFNPDFARSIGMNVRWIEFLITSLTVLAITSGIQALGVVLMSALIITPAAAARFWTNSLVRMLLIAVLFSVFSGVVGAYISYTEKGMPTGPWIVIVLSIITLVSFVVSTRSGILARYLVARRNRLKILHENILKAFYQFHENNERPGLSETVSFSELLNIRFFESRELQKGLKRLMRSGFVDRAEQNFVLTTEGIKESKRIVRLHRLWEHYLLRRTSIDPSHVHSGAEVIEHVLSPELERELEQELGITGIPKEDY